MLLAWTLLLAADAPLVQLPKGARVANAIRSGAHVALIVKYKDAEVGRQFVMLDGQRQADFDRILDPAFFDDGHFRYVGNSGLQNRALFDGLSEAAFKTLSPIVGHAGHHCYNGFSDGWYMVIDGVQRKLDGTPTSPRWAKTCVAGLVRGDGAFLVEGVKERAIPGIKRIDQVETSADGNTVAWVGTDKETKQKVFINGKAYAPGSQVQHIYLSADGKRVAFDGLDKNGNAFYTVDSKAEPGYAGGVSALTFSADGKHYAYVGRGRERLFFVRDGKATPSPLDKLGAERSVTLSKNGSRMAFAVRLGRGGLGDWMFVTPEAVSEAYADVRNIVFSDNSAHSAYIAEVWQNAADGQVKGAGVVVDGKLGPLSFGAFAAEIDDDGKVSYLSESEDGVVSNSKPDRPLP